MFLLRPCEMRWGMLMIDVEQQAAAQALERVLAAFPAAPFPRDLSVSTGGRWFDEDGQRHTYVDPEAAEVDRFFGGRPWTSIEPEQLLPWDHASVSSIFLSPRAHAYYLPAFLRAFLAAPLDGIAVDVLEHAVRMWTPPDAVSGQRWHTRTERQKAAMKMAREHGFREFVGALTTAQLAAVAEALAVLAPPFDEPDLENPVRTALDAFWSAHLPKG